MWTILETSSSGEPSCHTWDYLFRAEAATAKTPDHYPTLETILYLDSLRCLFRYLSVLACPLSSRSVSAKLPLNAMAGELQMIRALCGLNETFDKDVTIVLALNQISALIGIFFGNALRYLYLGCLSSIERSLTKMCMRNFEVSLNLYNKGINYALTEGWT